MSALAYDASCGVDPPCNEFPSEQGWTLQGNLDESNYTVAGGILHQGDTGSPLNTQFYHGTSVTFDFTSETVVANVNLKIITSTIDFPSAFPRAGWELSLIDTNALQVTLYVAEDKLFLIGRNEETTALITVPTTDGFHDYKLVVDSDGANLLYDGVMVPGAFLSLDRFRPRSDLANLMSIGDATTQAASETEVTSFGVAINRHPITDAGGPYTVAEGGTVQLDATGTTDPDQNATTLDYEWDLDGDGVFGETGADAPRGDEVGIAPTFLAAAVAQNATLTVAVRVTDSGGLSSTDTATINVVACTPPPDGLVSWWTGDGTAQDLVGGNHGTLVGGALFGAGKVQQAFALDGVNDFVEIPDQPGSGLEGMSTITVAAWVHPVSGASQYRSILTKYDTFPAGTANDQQSLYLSLAPSGEVLVVFYDASPTDTVGGETTAADIPLNAWSFVAATWDGSDLRIYVNAVAEAFTDLSSGSFTAVRDTTVPLRIGAVSSESTGGLGEFFPGRIDEVDLYNRALSPAEIQALFDAGIAGKCKNPHPIADAGGPYTVVEGGSIALDASATTDADQDSATLTYAWDLDGDGIFGETGSDAPHGDEVGTAPVFLAPAAATNTSLTVTLRVTDAGGLSSTDTATINVVVVTCVTPPDGLVGWWAADGTAEDLRGDHDASLHSGATFAPGYVDQAFALDGVDDWIAVAASEASTFFNDLFHGPGKQFTVEAWIRPDDLSSPGVILGKHNHTTNNRGFVFNHRNGFIEVELQDKAATVFGHVVRSAVPLREGEFQHVAVRYDATKSNLVERMRFFIDGVETGSVVDISGGSVGDYGTGNSAPLTIGATAALQSSGFFEGLIDEVGVYGRLVSDAEIQAIFDARIAGKCKNTHPLADAGGPYTIREGDSLTLDASASSDPDGDPLAFSWDVNGDGLFGDASGALPTLSWAQLQALGIDDDGTFTVTVRVTDGEGETDVSSALTVLNTPPEITLDGAATVDEGAHYTLTLGAVSDPGDDTVTQYIVHWGDGSSDTYTTAGDKVHIYADGPATHTITVDLVDEDGTHAAAGFFDEFFDDFEGDLSQWVGKSSPTGHGGEIVNDPLNSANKVLSFNRVTNTGDIVGPLVGTGAETYSLRFDYLGQGSPAGGFIGWSQLQSPGSHHGWFFGSPGSAGARFPLIDDGQWHSYELQIPAPGFGFPVRIIAEDVDAPGSVPGDALFDNIRFTATGVASLTVTVNNVAPTAVLSNSGPVGEGQPVTVSFSNTFDPSATDTNAGFLYSYDFNNDGDFADPGDLENVTQASASFTFGEPGTYTVRARIQDKDGGANEYTTVVVVENLVDLSGRVFEDRNNDGLFDADDVGLPDVIVQLFNEDDLSSVVATILTAADGSYAFDAKLGPGTYRIVEVQPGGGLLDGRETAGALGGTVDNTQDSNVISGIAVVAGDPDAGGYNFAEIPPARIQGLVWEDFNNNGEVDFGERAIEGVTIQLTGSDDRGVAIDSSMLTDADGIYEFTGLRPGNYTISELQPPGFADGLDVLGTVDGVLTGSNVIDDVFSDVSFLDRPGADAVNYNFGERPEAGSAVEAGQTATIGFWQNKNGQALIRALNGGPASTQLGNWLAATFSNVYAGLTGMTNDQVAAHYVTLFKRNGNSAPAGPPKVDAQALAVALAVYVTNESLAGTTAAGYGFAVSQSGVGYATFNVGENGAAFGVANGTEMTILDILLAANAWASDGLLYDLNGDGMIDSSERALREMANAVFSGINQQGDI